LDSHLCDLECRAGDVSQAFAYANESMRISEQGENDQDLAGALSALARVHAERGQEEAARGGEVPRAGPRLPIAAGNAFLAVELARLAAHSGTDADELSPAVLSRSSHVRRLAETRMRVLPEATRTTLGIVAALVTGRQRPISAAASRSRQARSSSV
jgi:hypothetical protein